MAKPKEIVTNLKKETYLNVRLLNRLRPMPSDLHGQIFKENGVEKLTQNIFNNLSYYLVSIINPQVVDKFSWPFYDTKGEKTFRGQLSVFINDYSTKGFLSPVLSSYLVNPSCYKVTLLIFQMSQLAVQRLLMIKMKKESQKELYRVMSEKYKAGSEDFVENVVKETDIMLSKLNKYLSKRAALEKIAALFRDRIVKMEEVLESSGAQKLLDNIVDQYISQTSLDDNGKNKILSIKDVNKPATIFDEWLEYADKSIEEMESKWTEKVTPLLELCQTSQKNTEALLDRHTGEAERSSYCIEFNCDTDEICTRELQNEVNSQQKFILKNIIKNERLYFPNLIRGFLISISYILKNNVFSNDISNFNEFLKNTHTGFEELIASLREVNNRVMNAESKLQSSPASFNYSTLVKEFEIPPLPDLSDIKCNRDLSQALFNSFTPLTMSKHQFNLRRKHTSFTFTRPESKPIITPFHQRTRDDLLKGLVSCRTSSYDSQNMSQNFHNIPMISQPHHRAKETLTECSSAGFTKHQIMRVLLTKKSSSSRKFKCKTERPDTNIKKGGLFKESAISNDSNGLFRSYSLPNLFENRENQTLTRGRRELSVMQEGSPSALDVSGIELLEKDASCEVMKLDSSSNLFDGLSLLPSITISPYMEKNIENVLNNVEIDLNDKEINTQVQSNDQSNEQTKSEAKEEAKTVTPKMNGHMTQKTNSLEKIINRYKKVRASVLPPEGRQVRASVLPPEGRVDDEFKTIIEEKENGNCVNVDVFTANRILLPDLLSPSCSGLSVKSTDYLDQLCIYMDEVESQKPRQSLGTALGVDNTFLDKFDLVD